MDRAFGEFFGWTPFRMATAEGIWSPLVDIQETKDTILLPSVVDANRVKATYRDGVLEIQLPKKEEAKPKEIKVEVA